MLAAFSHTPGTPGTAQPLQAGGRFLRNSAALRPPRRILSLDPSLHAALTHFVQDYGSLLQELLLSGDIIAQTNSHGFRPCRTLTHPWTT
jgi:hypothetical protein